MTSRVDQQAKESVDTSNDSMLDKVLTAQFLTCRKSATSLLTKRLYHSLNYKVVYIELENTGTFSCRKVPLNTLQAVTNRTNKTRPTSPKGERARLTRKEPNQPVRRTSEAARTAAVVAPLFPDRKRSSIRGGTQSQLTSLTGPQRV